MREGIGVKVVLDRDQNGQYFIKSEIPPQDIGVYRSFSEAFSEAAGLPDTARPCIEEVDINPGFGLTSEEICRVLQIYKAVKLYSRNRAHFERLRMQHPDYKAFGVGEGAIS